VVCPGSPRAGRPTSGRLRALDRGHGRYRLGIRLFELGTKVPSRRSLRVAAAPYLEDLSHTTRETAVLALPGHGEILFGEV
jgi:DNA-binding IclR family transcriptional regulator